MEVQLFSLFVTFVLVFLDLCECSIDLMFGHQCRHEIPKLQDVSQLYSCLCIKSCTLFSTCKFCFSSVLVFSQVITTACHL